MNQAIKLTTRAGLLAVALSVAVPATHAAQDDGLFKLKSASAVMQAMGASPNIGSKQIEVRLEAIAENPAMVPIEVRSRIPGTESIAILVDHNPIPLAALYRLTPSVGATITSRVKMSKSSPIRVVVRAKGKVYTLTRQVKVTEGGCGSPNYSTRADGGNNAVGKVLIRSQRAEAAWSIKGMIEHPMETGLRPVDQQGTMVQAIDKRTGKPLAPHYIREVTATVNDRPVLEALWGPSIAANPFFTFEVRSARPGDTLSIAATDNTGHKQSGSHILR